MFLALSELVWKSFASLPPKRLSLEGCSEQKVDLFIFKGMAREDKNPELFK